MELQTDHLTPDVIGLPDYSRFSLNANDLDKEMHWLENISLHRMKEMVEEGESFVSVLEIMTPPSLGESDYGKFIARHGYSYAERLAIILCFAAHYRVGLMEHFLVPNKKTGQRYKETGGVLIKDLSVFIPTLQTAFFLLAGTDSLKQAWYHNILHRKNRLFTDGVIALKNQREEEIHRPFFQMKIDSMYFNHFLNGKRLRLDETEGFPARLLETNATWDDVVLSEDAIYQLRRVIDYVKSHEAVSEKTGGQYQGMVLLLYGLPGTGKTLTASLLGKHLGIDTYQVDLSLITSKYVGETEKNINQVFDRFEDRNEILFFDEADALFGKRGEVQDTQDRYGNQEVSNLLVRLNSCKNLIILASNFKQNMDDAFQRRIIIEIELQRPDREERALMWKKLLRKPYQYENEQVVEHLSKLYTTTGANIQNILKVCVHQAESENNQVLTLKQLEIQTRWELINKEKKSPMDLLQWPEKAGRSSNNLPR